MRATPPYRCRECDRGGAAEDLCDPKCPEAKDTNGRSPPPPPEEQYEWMTGAVVHAGAILVRSAFLLGVALRRRRRRRQLARLFDAAGPPVPIADAPEGLTTIEGVVEALETTNLEGEPVVAFVRREPLKFQVERSTSSERVERVTVRRFSGKLVVRDETSEALIDDDWLLLLDAEGDELTPRGGAAKIVVRDGDRVRVTGYARPSEEWVPSARSSFRGHARGLELSGGPRRPVVIRPA